MAANDDTEAARDYHRATSHSEESLHKDRHYLDFDNQPLPFKIYPQLEPLRLPTDLTGTNGPGARPSAEPGHGLPRKAELARLLYLSAGVLRRKSYPGGSVYFRAYANTGALYHVDLYLVCAELPDLEAGVYHFGPHDFALRRLRGGDHRSVLAGATGDEPRVTEAPVLLVSASTYWRNAWKYRDRAYRHCFWDAGTMHANLLAVGADRGLEPRVVVGFADRDVEELLGLDPHREAALTIVALGRGTPGASGGSGAPGSRGGSRPAPLVGEAFETLALSNHEIDYPRIRRIHEASSLDDGSQAGAWRVAAATVASAPAASRPVFALEPSPSPAGDELVRAILRRGSTRRFDRDLSLSRAQLSSLLGCAAAPLSADFLADPSASLLDFYLIVHAVDGLPSGAYFYRRADHALELLHEGDLRRIAARLALFQDLAADAAVNVYSLTDLDRVLPAFGNRGYRAAQLEGGIRGGRLYFSAYAQGFGATGLTFLDEEVTELFSPHAAGKSVMFLVACGRTAGAKR